MAGAVCMNICNDNHTEICYASYNCPMCELLVDLAQLRTEYETLEKEFEDCEHDLNQHWNENLKFRAVLQSIAPEHLLWPTFTIIQQSHYQNLILVNTDRGVAVYAELCTLTSDYKHITNYCGGWPIDDDVGDYICSYDDFQQQYPELFI